MAFSISKFRGGALNASGARPNLFDAQLTKNPVGINPSNWFSKSSLLPRRVNYYTLRSSCRKTYKKTRLVNRESPSGIFPEN